MTVRFRFIVFCVLGCTTLIWAACVGAADPSGAQNAITINNSTAPNSATWQTPGYFDDVPFLLIGIDGFKPEYLERIDTPNFDRLIDNGVLAEGLIPVFPSKTFPNMYSIATGLYAENTGIISNNMYDEERDLQFSMNNSSSTLESFWWEGEPIWVTAEKQGVKTGTLFWVGSEVEIKGVRPSTWVSYSGAWPYERRIDTAINWLLAEPEERPSLITIYFSTPDKMGHEHGPNSTEMNEAIKRMDVVLGYLLNKLEQVNLWPNINMMIVSDHGMTEQSEDKIIYLDNYISLNDVRVVDWTPTAMLQPKEGQAQKVYDQLKQGEQTHGNFKVYWKEDLPQSYRLKNHPRVPDIIMVADLPYVITSRYFYQQNGIMAGNHGFDPQEPDMHAFFLAHGPAFASGKKIPAFELVHLYEVMTTVLGLQPAANDGDISVVGPLLFEP